MTAHNATGAREATHVWVPFLDTSLYVQFTDETDRAHGTAGTYDPGVCWPRPSPRTHSHATTVTAW